MISFKYAAPGSGEKGIGTFKKPWTIKRSFINAVPGDTVLFRGGVYESIGGKDQFSVRCSGVSNGRIIFKPYEDELPIIDGSKNDQPSKNGAVRFSGSYIDFIGFRLQNFHYMIGMKIAGSFNLIKNNVILRNADHKRDYKNCKCGCGKFAADPRNRCGDGAFSLDRSMNNSFINNIFWGNGTNQGYDQGMYIQGINHLIVNNLFAFSSGLGFGERLGGNNNYHHNTVFMSKFAGFGINNWTDKESPFWEGTDTIEKREAIRKLSHMNFNIAYGGKVGINMGGKGNYDNNVVYNPNGFSRGAVQYGEKPSDLIEKNPMFINPPKTVYDYDTDWNLFLKSNSPVIGYGRLKLGDTDDPTLELPPDSPNTNQELNNCTKYTIKERNRITVSTNKYHKNLLNEIG